MEIAGEELKTYALDHHGLIASICKDLRIAEKIDVRIGKQDCRRIVSTGMAAVGNDIEWIGVYESALVSHPSIF